MNSWFPPPAKPIEVEGGIRARSRRGAIAQSWWSERFIDVMESIVVGGRLQRGRTYARKGQVIAMDVDAGAVTATVQGSRPRPYRVRIGLAAFGKKEWAAVCQTLADDAWHTAKLLAGEMPEEIEDVFASVGLSLFPAGEDELTMDCACPDWSVPCKHLAAVFFLLAESFDDDPFGILAWRGRDRDELLDTLAALRTGGVAADRAEDAEAAVALTECLDSYYVPAADVPGHAPAQAPADAVLDQVQAVDIAVRSRPLTELLRPAYHALAGDAAPTTR